MKKLTFYLIGFIALLTVSCSTPKDITYLQDITLDPIATQTGGEIRFQPGDKLSIVVHSRDEQLRSLFNIGGSSGSSTTMMSSGGRGAYTIAPDGTIDFPVLGRITIEGKTREEVARFVKDEIVSNNLCNDPVVLVEFYNMSFYVLGDMGTGARQINKDKINVLEAISMSGDLQMDGLRKNVLVLRQQGDQRVPYRIDLTDSKSVYNSPAYYIRQNDIVYVEPNDKHKRSSTVNGSQFYAASFWMSFPAYLMGLYALFFK